MHLRLLYKKFLCVFMSLMIVILSTQSAYANTSIGGWSMVDAITAGSTNTINAIKGAGDTALKSSAVVTANAGKVGKYIIKGGGQAALAYAMVELLDAGIDWVLDPANNRVKYTVIGSSSETDHPQAKRNYTLVYSESTGLWTGSSGRASGTTAELACSSYETASWRSAGVVMLTDITADCYYIPTSVPVVPVDKYIPIDVVAAKVISNAAAGHAPSQETVKAVAVEQFVAGGLDAELEANAVPNTDTSNPPDTDNPPDTNNPPSDKPLPFDPSSIIAAINALGAKISSGFSSLLGALGVTNAKLDEVVAAENATADAVTAGAGDIVAAENATTSVITDFSDWWKSQWVTFSTAITDFNEWVRAEPDVESLQPEPVEVSDSKIEDGWQDKATAGYVNMSGKQCPKDVLIPISYMGASTNLSLSYVPFCHFASIIRYAVILGAWVAALMIISGGRTKE